MTEKFNDGAEPKWFSVEKGHGFSDSGFIQKDHHNIHTYVWDILPDENNVKAAQNLSAHLQTYFNEWHDGVPEIPNRILYAFLSLNQDADVAQNTPWFGTLHIIDDNHKEYMWTIGEGGPTEWHVKE